MGEKLTIENDRLAELRAAIERIPGSDRRSWILEVYNVVDGEELLSGVIDIKTGRPVRWRPETTISETTRG